MLILARMAALALALIGSPAFAFVGALQPVVAGPQVAPVAGVTAPIYFNLAKGGYPISNGTCATYGHFVPCAFNVSRASSGYVNTSDGNWWSVPSGALRATNSGALIEEGRTNSVRNNTMVGAVVMADNVEMLNTSGGVLNSANWTLVQPGSSTVTFGAGTLSINSDGTNRAYATQQITGLVVGRNYVVSANTNTGNTRPQIAVGTTSGGTELLNYNAVQGNGQGSGSVTDRYAFTATQATAWVSLSRLAAGTATFTSVSVMDGEHVQNGGFSADPLNASQSTVQNGWQWSLAGTSNVTYSGGAVQLISDGSGNPANLNSMALPTVSGFTYTLSFDLSGGTNAVVRAGTTLGGLTLLNSTRSMGVGQQVQFTAQSSTTYLTFINVTASTTVTVDNVSLLSAGKIPTNYSWYQATNPFIISVSGVGQSNGLPTTTFNVSGTPSVSTLQFFVDGATVIAATYGQTWTHSGFYAMSNLTNLTGLVLGVRSVNSGGTILADTTGSLVTAGTSLGRQSFSMTPTNSATAYVRPIILFSGITAGNPINFDFTVAAEQLENNNINSSVTSAAKASDGTGGVNGSAVYSVGGGTGTAATLNVTWAAGVMTVNSVASAGDYTTFPPSPATLTYVSGAATGWTGATVNLTPTDNAASGFATSPIATTGTSAARAADVVTMNYAGAFGGEETIYAKARPQAPVTSNVTQYFVVVSDGSTTNRIGVIRSTNGVAQALANTGGGSPTIGATSWPQNALGKIAAATRNADLSMSFNGSAITNSSSLGSLTGLNAISIGSRQGGTAQTQTDGFLLEGLIHPYARLPDQQLQNMTTP